MRPRRFHPHPRADPTRGNSVLVPFPLEYALYQIPVSPARRSRASWNPQLEVTFQYRQDYLEPVLVLQRRVMRKHAQVFFFSYGPFIMGDSHSFVASFKIRPRVTL